VKGSKLIEFRPGVLARWMEEMILDHRIWRFDGQQFRARNCADTGFADDKCCKAENLQTPPWLAPVTGEPS